jgi:hypothetical protein
MILRGHQPALSLFVFIAHEHDALHVLPTLKPAHSSHFRKPSTRSAGSAVCSSTILQHKLENSLEIFRPNSELRRSVIKYGTGSSCLLGYSRGKGLSYNNDLKMYICPFTIFCYAM